MKASIFSVSMILVLSGQIAWSANFPLLVSSNATSSVLKYNADGSFNSTFTSTPTAPDSIVQGPDGNVYVTTFGTGGFGSNNGTIQRYSPTGAAVGTGVFVQATASVLGEVFSPDGYLYFTTPNAVERAFGPTMPNAGTIDSTYNYPTATNAGRGVAIIPTGPSSYVVAVANGTGFGQVTYITSSSSPTLIGSSNGGGGLVQGLGYNPSSDTLIETNGSTGGIYALSNASTANFSAGPAFTLLTSAHTNVPLSPIFDSNGNIYVSNNGGVSLSPFDNVVEFSSTGTYLGDFVTPGEGGLNGASGIAFLTPEPAAFMQAAICGLVGCALFVRRRWQR